MEAVFQTTEADPKHCLNTIMQQKLNTLLEPGTLLVAHPNLKDPFFEKSVVLITENHPVGVMGLCINQSSGLEISQILARHGVDWGYNDELMIGGPVNDQMLVILHTNEWSSTSTLRIGNDVAITSDTLMAEKLAMGDLPVNVKFLSGTCGWKPGQLEKEIYVEKSWLTCESSESILFSNSKNVWKEAIQMCASNAIGQYI
jgi:putative transcriptional regulator